MVIVVALGEFIQSRGKIVETEQGDKIKVIESGREVRVWGTQYILKVRDCIVMRRENEEFGAFRVQTNVTSGIVGDSGCDLKDLGAGGCVHACFCAQGGSPVEKTVSAAVVGGSLHINALACRRLCRSRVFIMPVGNGVF